MALLETELAQLQDDMATVDLLTRRSPPGVIELLVKRFQQIRIRIDGDKNHARPHLHIDYGREYHAASYAIDTGERLAGMLDTKYNNAVQEWIAKSRPVLIQAWALTQAGQNADPIVRELRGSEFG